MQRVQLFLLIRLIDLPQTPTKCGLGSQRRDTNIFGSEHAIQIFGEPENISVGKQFSEKQSTVLREPEHGSLRNRAWSLRTRSRFSENQSTVLREPELGSSRTRARLSENQSTPKLENWRTPQWRTGEHLHVFHLLRVLHVLHVLRTYSTCSQPGW